jgi:hypothetical protein
MCAMSTKTFDCLVSCSCGFWNSLVRHVCFLLYVLSTPPFHLPSAPAGLKLLKLVLSWTSSCQRIAKLWFDPYFEIVCLLWVCSSCGIIWPAWMLQLQWWDAVKPLSIISEGTVKNKQMHELYLYVAVPWLRLLVAGLSSRRPGFASRSIHVGFVVHKVALGQVYLQVIWFSPVSIIPLSLSKLISSGECIIC